MSTTEERRVTSWSNASQLQARDFTNCSAAVETVESLDLDCSNATRTERRVELGLGKEQTCSGSLCFTVAFSMFLSRQGRGADRRGGNCNTQRGHHVNCQTPSCGEFSPVGIASIIMGELLKVEDFVGLVQQIGLYMVTVLLGLFIHGCITLPLLFLVLTRSNPIKLVRHTAQALLTAFGTSSRFVNCFPFCAYSTVLSRYPYPPLLYSKPFHVLQLYQSRSQCLEEKAGVDSRVTRFMLPVGATINMDGTALYEAVAVVFIAQVEGVNMNFATLLIICITAIAASIGAATVSSAGLVTMLREGLVDDSLQTRTATLSTS
ncbi:Excitatory amino acid transporter [Geodia barretti]|uniref:Amino acid transporter n=1 Tax=Geodia barretti TaxID=519541 RepID=A0AA35SDZ1_GEOBA|nr:Excitatory amino acid transporter [Geodia barretti]